MAKCGLCNKTIKPDEVVTFGDPPMSFDHACWEREGHHLAWEVIPLLTGLLGLTITG